MLRILPWNVAISTKPDAMRAKRLIGPGELLQSTPRRMLYTVPANAWGVLPFEMAICQRLRSTFSHQSTFRVPRSASRHGLNWTWRETCSIEVSQTLWLSTCEEPLSHGL